MNIKKNNILITGAAGFIGAALAEKFLSHGYNVIGLDNLNDYYDKNLKLDRVRKIEKKLSYSKKWKFEKASIINKEKLSNIFSNYKPKIVINLAAQAGVRYSLKKPLEYINSNIVGFGNILEICREFEIEHLIYASSSSVYGGNKVFPFEESQKVDNPINIYAATKVSNELMANAYSHLYKMPATGLRFFTVYGPWGRPDMAPMIFAKSIFEKKPINIFNFGKMERDFTFIEDIIEGIFRCCFKPPQLCKNVIGNEQIFSAPHKIFNIGNSQPIQLLEFINLLEENIGIKATKNFTEIQPGDVVRTFSNTNKLKNWVNYSPSTSIEKGVSLFIKWYKDYYNY